MTLVRTDALNPDFVGLVRLLDSDLAKRDGEEHAFYHQFNGITQLNHVVLYYQNGIPLGCGAIKPFDKDTMEVKRMYTAPEARGKGIASAILSELEAWAATLGYSYCILETGIKQPEAIGLYTKQGYSVIPNYGQYENVANSKCFKKTLGQ
ncbi:GNAT family N-acetyltransferase [Formosa sp. S-31]|uniref:GNAT family N-acetyltransferase n=1 Tax=Formosa sp. S-31 TaxID=2790949 RepID=UPI003EBD1CF2